jgi:phosphoglycolate phosphatase
MKKLLLFDIDGTLLRAEDATRNALNRAFLKLFDIEETLADISFLGRTDPELFQEASLKLRGRKLEDSEYVALVQQYLKLLPEELQKCVFRLMPGVPELLKELSARKNVLLGLETGNLEPSAYMKLKKGNIAQYFSFGGFGSDSADRTELVRRAIARSSNFHSGNLLGDNIYVIGDSPYDIAAGKACGANTIAVGTGTVSKAKLLAEMPALLLADLSDTKLVLRQFGL